jgi:splicing factor 4
MAYRGIKGSDPFASKTTRNERFAQMSKQEQLIEQKKREIQAKLEDQKKKETEEALKKLQSASGNSRSSGNRSNSQAGQHKGGRKPFWKR